MRAIFIPHQGENCYITQRKKAEESLRSSESRFRAMFDSNVVGMIFADFQGHILDANDYFLKIIGYTREELEANEIDWLAMTPAEHLPKDLMCMEDLRKYGEISPWEKEYFHKEGHRVAILIGAAYLTESRDETICVVIDISDRKRAEEELRKSRAKFQRLVDDMGDKFVVFSHNGIEGIVSYVSDGVEAIFGISRHTAIGTNWAEAINWLPDELPKARARLIQMYQGEQDFFQSEMGFIHPDGQLHTIQVSEHPVRNKAGEIIAIEGIIEDITERKRDEITLKNANMELERLLTLREETLTFREDMSHMIVHDLRNPLTSVLLAAEMIPKYANRINAPLSLLKNAEQILTSGQRMKTMIDSLLLMAKLESGKILFNPIDTDLSELGTAILTEFELTANNQKIELKGSFPHPSNTILIDAIILRRIIENLISNALKFSPPNSQIMLSLEYLPENHIRVKVADNGPGVTPEEAEQIFQKFEIGTVKQNTAQIGLGLAFCKMAVEAQGGTLTLSPNQPHGAIFTVEI